ncbi:MAG: arsenate reductase ArsC [Parvularculales bacterium]
MANPLSVLFLCTGNSCRSIMAEALLAHHGGSRFLSHSAGSFPTGDVHPKSLATLKAHGIATTDYQSKSWDEFTDQPIDIVITVCDTVASEICPIFPGEPLKAHWGVPDPAKFEGSEEATGQEFNRIFAMLERRIKALIHLPLESMNKIELQRQLETIGTL